MALAVYVTGILLFVLAFWLTRLSHSFIGVMAVVNQAIKVMADGQLDDHEKERTARFAAFQLLKHAALITLKAVVTLISAGLPFLLADVLALQPWSESMSFALRWDVLLITTVIMLVIWQIWRRWQASGS